MTRLQQSVVYFGAEGGEGPLLTCDDNHIGFVSLSVFGLETNRFLATTNLLLNQAVKASLLGSKLEDHTHFFGNLVKVCATLVTPRKARQRVQHSLKTTSVWIVGD